MTATHAHAQQRIFGMAEAQPCRDQTEHAANCGSCVIDDGRSDQWWWPDMPTC